MLNLHDLGECDTPADIKWMLVALVVELPNDRVFGIYHLDKLAVILVKFLNFLIYCGY
jgi:hypothetical protein